MTQTHVEMVFIDTIDDTIIIPAKSLVVDDDDDYENYDQLSQLDTSWKIPTTLVNEYDADDEEEENIKDLDS
jgi:hypothetical protein